MHDNAIIIDNIDNAFFHYRYRDTIMKIPIIVDNDNVMNNFR